MARTESIAVRPVLPPGGSAVPLGVRPTCVHNTNLGAAGEKYAVALTFRVPFSMRAVEVWIPGWRLNPLESGGPEFPLPAPITAKAAVRVTFGPSARNAPVVWDNGGRLGTVPPGGWLRGVAAVPLSAGWQVTVALFLDPGASGQVPVSVISSAADPGVRHARGPSLTFDPDTWDGSGVVQSVAESSPSIIVAGLPATLPIPVPAVALLGDSITFGLGDTPTGWGYAVRALQAAGVPWVSCAVGGDYLATPPWGGVQYRLQTATRYARWVLEAWGTNNVSLGAVFGATDAAAIKGGKLDCWRALARAGFGVASCVNTPVRNSDPTVDARCTQIRQDLVAWQRDGAPWDTAAGTPAAVGASGATISRCLVLSPSGSVARQRSGPPHPVAVMFDTGGAVDVGGDNQWATGMNADTVHPSTAGHQAMANAVQTQVFQQEPPVYTGP